MSRTVARVRRSTRGSIFKLVVAAQAAAILALAVLLYVERSTREAPRFHTLTQTDATLAAGKPLARVAFDAGVGEAEVAAIAARVGATLVAGPGANNIYTFAFDSAPANGTRSDESLNDKVARLRREGSVLLAEPIAPGADP